MAKLILHIGFPKTATTTLQEDFFYGHDNILNIGKPYSSSDDESFRVFEVIRYGTDAEFESWFSRIVLFFNGCLKKKDVLALSNEAIMGTDSRRINPVEFFDSSVRTLLRFKRIQSASEIKTVQLIMGVRRQDDLMVSRYAQAVEQGIINPRKVSAEKFILNSLDEPDTGVMLTQYFSLVASVIDEIFLPGNLFIFPFEAFKGNPTRVLSQISQFVGVTTFSLENFDRYSHRNRKTKVGNSYVVETNLYALLRNLKRSFFPELGVPNWVHGLLKMTNFRLSDTKVYVSDELRSQVLCVYREDNKKISDSYHLNLELYGYF